ALQRGRRGPDRGAGQAQSRRRREEPADRRAGADEARHRRHRRITFATSRAAGIPSRPRGRSGDVTIGGGTSGRGNSRGRAAYVERAPVRRNVAMSLRTLLLGLTAALIPAASFAGPSLTLYTSDLGLVKESRAVDFRGGRDTLRLENVSNRLDA